MVPNNWLSPSSRWPLTGEFLDKNFAYHSSISICYLGTKSNILFSLARNGKWIKQASKQASKNQEPINSSTQRRPSWIWDTEVGLLRPKAFTRLFQRDNSGVLCWSFYNDNTENRESTPKTHWGWHLPSDESIGGVHSSGYGDAPLPFGDIIE